ncbi:MAG: ornithine carbamoyltransferase [Deltaproteobacteria bacterium]|jgi:ornithine carbamoyltransferase|nr:ornithine carbamoyltransferase [Deltaproteobacteria bacterium]
MSKHFITFRDITADECAFLFTRTAKLKAERQRNQYMRPHLGGRPVGLFFAKPSTRTRVSFECAINELGGHAVVLQLKDTQFSRGEPLSHSARVLSRYLSALVIRTFDENELVELSKWGSIPVVNALTDLHHPCQVLADIFTLTEHLNGRPLEKQLVAWIGDGNNMANTWIEAAAVLGFSLNLACPEGHDPNKEILKRGIRDNPGIKLMRSPAEAVTGAGAVNTDVIFSMGQQGEPDQKFSDFRDYQVNSALMAKAAPGAIFMHCLPAHPGEEVTDEVLESPASVIFDEAENRLHVQKALLEYLIPAL